MDWMLMPLRRYADFSGRSRRQEYWMFALFQLLVLLAMGMVVGLLLAITGESSGSLGDTVGSVVVVLFVIIWLGLFLIPNLSVAVRRFHDQGLSGWMYLLNLIPYLGGIIIFVFMCLPGTRGPNQYGDDPLGTEYLSDVFR